jgi:hypothetical protein
MDTSMMTAVDVRELGERMAWSSFLDFAGKGG